MENSKVPQSRSGDSAEQLRRECLELVRWLLDFLRRDLGKIPTADWPRVQRKLDHLTWKLAGRGAVFPVTWLKQLESRRRGKPLRFTSGTEVLDSRSEHLTFLDERRNEPKFRVHLPKLTRAEIRKLQARLRQVLEELRPIDSGLEPSWPRIMYPSIPGSTKSIHLMNDLSDESRLGIKRVFGADWRHLRWLAITSLLEEFGAQIIRCKAPECRRLFLRNRRQEYCSPKCSQKVRSIKWYTEHRESAKARRRLAYRQESERERQGASVKERNPR